MIIAVKKERLGESSARARVHDRDIFSYSAYLHAMTEGPCITPLSFSAGWTLLLRHQVIKVLLAAQEKQGLSRFVLATIQ